MARKKKKPSGQSARQDAAKAVKKAKEAELAETLRLDLQNYRTRRATVTARFKNDPTLPLRQKADNLARVPMALQALAEAWKELFPYIRKIRPLIPDLLAHTRLVACYLLFGKISQSTEAMMMLLKAGFSQEFMVVSRSNYEALDLISLFLREPDNSPILEKWFAGEIVENAKARESAHEWLNETARQAGLTISIEGMMSAVYGVLSQYTHVSYGALLEQYDPFRDDFDFERVAGAHYALTTGVSHLRAQIETVIITLKALYQAIGDQASFRELDIILRKYAPRMFDREAMEKNRADVIASLDEKSQA